MNLICHLQLSENVLFSPFKKNVTSLRWRPQSKRQLKSSFLKRHFRVHTCWNDLEIKTWQVKINEIGSAAESEANQVTGCSPSRVFPLWWGSPTGCNPSKTNLCQHIAHPSKSASLPIFIFFLFPSQWLLPLGVFEQGTMFWHAMGCCPLLAALQPAPNSSSSA